jgi:hypothetical protein
VNGGELCGHWITPTEVTLARINLLTADGVVGILVEKHWVGKVVGEPVVGQFSNKNSICSCGYICWSRMKRLSLTSRKCQPGLTWDRWNI